MARSESDIDPGSLASSRSRVLQADCHILGDTELLSLTLPAKLDELLRDLERALKVNTRTRHAAASPDTAA